MLVLTQLSVAQQLSLNDTKASGGLQVVPNLIKLTGKKERNNMRVINLYAFQ